MKKFDVISIGSSLRDIFLLNKDLRYPSENIKHPFDEQAIGSKIKVNKMYFDVGGGGSNSAATFANMGLKTGLISRLADDVAGKEIIRVMKKFKVDTSIIEIDPKGETGYSVIFIGKDGDRTALSYRGASDFRGLSKIRPNKLSTKWFFITSLNGNLSLLKKVFDTAIKDRSKIAWNPGLLEIGIGVKKMKFFLENIDVLILNFKEAQKLANLKVASARKLLDKLDQLIPGVIIAITIGKNGAWVKAAGVVYFAPALNVKVINATGAGDAFGSGFVSGLILYNNNIKKSLQLAILNSNSVVRKMGAKHGLLDKKPLASQLNKVKIKIIA